VMYFLIHRIFYAIYGTWSNCQIFSKQWSSYHLPFHYCAVSLLIQSRRVASLSTVLWLSHSNFYRIAFHSTCFMQSTMLS
jgi:hypothetical protein